MIIYMKTIGNIHVLYNSEKSVIGTFDNYSDMQFFIENLVDNF